MSGRFHILKKRKIGMLFLCFLLVFSFYGCRIRWNPTGDWAYDDLPGGYALWRVNSKTIELEHNISKVGISGATASRVIGTYISAICNNDRFIAVRWTNAEEIDFENIKGHDFSTAEYYIVDSVTENLFGPFETETEYLAKCDALSVGELSDWIDVLDMPNILGDKYYD